jgi:hypothetical protein
MKRGLAIAAVLALAFLAIALHTSVKDFLWVHPWWHSTLVALPGIVLAVLAYFELHHSREANGLREQANRLRRQIAELEAERNQHLQQIAQNTRRAVTQAERNAAILRGHIGARVKVSEEHGNWGTPPQIVEVSDDHIVTLFTPRGYSTTTAWCVRVRCDDLQITEIPEGSCPLRVKVLNRYGQEVQLGEITKWEDRLEPQAAPTFHKGPNVRNASYGKPGTSDVRSLNVFLSNDGTNSFLLEASTGEAFRGDNIQISKDFMLLQIGYEADGFTHRGSGTGGSPYPLFIKTTA